MHISEIKSKQGDKIYRGVLLRQSYRDENGKSQKRTIANLSALDPGAIEVLKAYYQGKKLIEADAGEPFETIQSLMHGPVLAIANTFECLNMPQIISSKSSRQRNLVCAMIAARILKPSSKLDTVAWWDDTTIAEVFSIPKGQIKAEDLYKAMDWLIPRQNQIQKKLAGKVLHKGCIALYDVSSSYYEGSKCPLAQHGYSRDKKRGKPQVNYGLLCDHLGRPVSISVCEGNINDHKTLMAEVRRLQTDFELSHVILVGDRGMMIKADLEQLKEMEGVHWITALRKASIRKIARKGTLNLDDLGKAYTNSIGEICDHPDYPEERLIVCRNGALRAKLKHQRIKLIELTEEGFDAIKSQVDKQFLITDAAIGLAVGRAQSRYKVSKYFDISIENQKFSYERKTELIELDESLDGVYVIRTSLGQIELAKEDCVRAYKSLSRVERAFRCLKSEGLQVRPIHHRLPDRVRCHVFLCMLAYYVEWHMRYLWRDFTYADPAIYESVRVRDPVKAAQKGEEAKRKASTKRTLEGEKVRKFRSLLWSLSTIQRKKCRINLTDKGKSDTSSERSNCFEMTDKPDRRQAKLLRSLKRVSHDHFEGLELKCRQ